MSCHVVAPIALQWLTSDKVGKVLLWAVLHVGAGCIHFFKKKMHRSALFIHDLTVLFPQCNATDANKYTRSLQDLLLQADAANHNLDSGGWRENTRESSKFLFMFLKKTPKLNVMSFASRIRR
jgi:hypothetical protein